MVNLAEHARERIGGFSGGMKQRLLPGQAFLNDPKLLILDEPTAGADLQERIRNFISEIASARIVLLATHIVSNVEANAKEILLMKQGRLIRRGAPYELFEEIAPMVYEIIVPQEKLHEIEQQYVVSNLRNTTDGLAVKIIT